MTKIAAQKIESCTESGTKLGRFISCAPHPAASSAFLLLDLLRIEPELFEQQNFVVSLNSPRRRFPAALYEFLIHLKSQSAMICDMILLLHHLACVRICNIS